MTDNKKIEFSSEDLGKRLDIFLTSRLEITRSQVKKMILEGRVIVNSEKGAVHHFIKDGDKIEIASKIKAPEIKKDNKSLELTDSDIALFNKIVVVADEKDFLVIEKPASLLVHQTEKGENNTLVDWLLKNYPELRQIGEDPSRPALVHRLDKDVSGLMVIPKSQDSFENLKRQFKLHTVTKEYTALVYGQIENNTEQIDLPIGRSKTKPGLFAAHPIDHGHQFSEKDRKATTIFNVEKRFTNHTLLKIEITTGRTHQIRVHMLAYGYPIVGDRLYALRSIKKAGLTRIFLHASHLEFKDEQGNNHQYDSSLPEKLQAFLSSLDKK